MFEFWMALSFLIATIGFSLVGIDAISDVYWAMKGEFEIVKKEKEEVRKEMEKLSVVCLNCGTPLRPEMEKCPKCGSKNRSVKMLDSGHGKD